MENDLQLNMQVAAFLSSRFAARTTAVGLAKRVGNVTKDPGGAGVVTDVPFEDQGKHDEWMRLVLALFGNKHLVRGRGNGKDKIFFGIFDEPFACATVPTAGKDFTEYRVGHLGKCRV